MLVTLCWTQKTFLKFYWPTEPQDLGNRILIQAISRKGTQKLKR